MNLDRKDTSAIETLTKYINSGGGQAMTVRRYVVPWLGREELKEWLQDVIDNKIAPDIYI